MMTSAGVDHVLTVIAVADLEAAVVFYRDAFGWTVNVEAPVYVEFQLARGQRFGLYARAGFAHNTGLPPSVCPPERTTATEVYLFCDDLEASRAKLLEAGGRELSPLALRPWGDEAAYYADLDGNVLVLARPQKKGKLTPDTTPAQ